MVLIFVEKGSENENMSFLTSPLSKNFDHARKIISSVFEPRIYSQLAGDEYRRNKLSALIVRHSLSVVMASFSGIVAIVWPW